MRENAGRAIGRHCIVKAWMYTHVVYRPDIVEKDLPDGSLPRTHAVDVNVFLRLAISCTDTDYITLVGDDIIELVLPEKTREC